MLVPSRSGAVSTAGSGTGVVMSDVDLNVFMQSRLLSSNEVAPVFGEVAARLGNFDDVSTLGVCDHLATPVHCCPRHAAWHCEQVEEAFSECRKMLERLTE